MMIPPFNLIFILTFFLPYVIINKDSAAASTAISLFVCGSFTY